MAGIVVFCTTYALILPAITMEQSYACGIEAHEHTPECYTASHHTRFLCSPEQLSDHVHSVLCDDENGTRTCGYSDFVLHTHQDVCYDGEGNLICPLPEIGEHSHDESCMDGDTLICGKEQVIPHIHDSACLDEPGNLICNLTEIREHTHSEDCIQVSEEPVLTCTQAVHIHDDTCLPKPEADLETAEVWEKTFAHIEKTGDWPADLTAIARSQLGYTESGENYLPDSTEPQHYTRYGQWYGIPYGSWDDMFLSFCLHYAGIPEEAIPRESDTQRWVTQLEEMGILGLPQHGLPGTGDLVFYTLENEEELRSAIMLSQEVGTNPDTGADEITGLKLLAGDVSGKVDEIVIPLTGYRYTCTMAVARLRCEALFPELFLEQTPENPDETLPATPELLTQTAETENYIVTITYSAFPPLPEGAELRVVEYPRDSEIFRQRCAEAGYELEWLMNIGFFLDGQELDLQGIFDVVVTSKEGTSLGSDIVHFADDGTEHIDGSSEDGDSSVSFSSQGFSDFGGGINTRAIATTYTVANPNNLTAGQYIIFVRSGNNYLALGNNGSFSRDTIVSNVYNAPSVGQTLNISGNASNYVWNLTLGSGGNFYLVSPNGQYLHADWNGAKMANDAKPHVAREVNGAGFKLAHPWSSGNSSGTNWLTYNNGWGGGTSSNSAAVIYLLRVNQTSTPDPTDPSDPDQPDMSYPYHPQAVETGEVNVHRLRFYNICEDGSNGVSALADCVFEIKGIDNSYTATVRSGNDPEINLPEGIPDGKYTITEVSTPAGYMRDTDPSREFWISGGKLSSEHNIGTFINHHHNQLSSNKTAEVEDYNNRIYQVLMNAESHMRMYEMDPIDVLFVVDRSNSMLFPSGLVSTGKTVTLKRNDAQNVNRIEALNLDKSKMHYIIADPTGTSTVWCVWYDGKTWMCQDASYYAKAEHNNEGLYKTPGELAIFPEDLDYSAQKTTIRVNGKDETCRANGAGLGKNLGNSSLGKYIGDGGSKEFIVYTAKDEYNRMHYLEEALANMVYALADVNPHNRITLVPFTKVVQETIPDPDNPNSNITMPMELTTSNVEKLVDIVTHIDTSGGTRQDKALKHAYETYLQNNKDGKDKEHTYTILISDGAPVESDNDSLTTIYNSIRNYGASIRNESTLMSVALGMGSVEGGSSVLKEIATSDQFYCALDDADELIETMQKVLFDSFRPKDPIFMTGDVTDVISDSFYPIACVPAGTGAATGRQVLVSDANHDWILLQAGDWITQNGEFTTAGAGNASGQLLQQSDGTFYIQWLDIPLCDPWHDTDKDLIAWVDAGTGHSSGRTVVATGTDRDWILLNAGDWITQQGKYQPGNPSSTQKRSLGQITQSGSDFTVSWGRNANGNNRITYVSDHTWHGTFYVKAKEDFIGGNAIHTNKSATVSTEYTTKNFERPTVNVRLLDMTEHHSEVTVYLGDLINAPDHSPLDSLQAFYNATEFRKLIADSGDVLNAVAVGAEGSDGLTDATFFLRYAMGRDLTMDEWTALSRGGTITVPYLYDNDSSNGAVGYFTFRLEKTGIEGSHPDYPHHEATAACQPGGSPLSENCSHPAETYTLHVTYTAYKLGEGGRPSANQYNGSGSPGTQVGTGSTLPTGLGTLAKHNVHEVHVISGVIEVDKTFLDGLTSDTDQTFTFQLKRLEDGWTTTQTITIPAGATAAGTPIRFTNLERGTYTVTEAEHPEFAPKSATVDPATNCQSSVQGLTATFHLGLEPGGSNVIGLQSSLETYTAYVHPGKGVWGGVHFTNGEIVFTGQIPVRKVWSDGANAHDTDAVYVVLYGASGDPVLDSDGNARILRLDAASDWKGAFTVVLEHKDVDVTTLGYYVREVSKTDDTPLLGWLPAVLENDGTTILYYEKALDHQGLLGVDGQGYMVSYDQDADGTWVVTNSQTLSLPSTGGIGTQFHTFGGLLILAAALMYYCITGHRRRKGGTSG